MDLIGQEVGVEPSELKTESEFAELGVDSLLSLTITSKIRDELGLDFPPSLFIDHPTVGDLQVLIGGGEDDGLPATRSSSNSSSDEESDETQLTSSATSVFQDTLQQEESSSRLTGSLLVVRQTIAEETRVPIDELKPSTSLTEIGVDSLLGLTISGKLQELLDLDIPGSMFVEFETLQDVEEALCKALGLKNSNLKRPGEPSNYYSAALDASLANSNIPWSSGSSDRQISLEDTGHQTLAVTSLPQATSILLSGSPQTSRLSLFLFPDGSGSASSYAALATVIDTSSIAVYGLNCPWRKTGAEMTRLGVTMSTMVARYVAEVRRILQQQHSQTTKGQEKFSASTSSVAVGGWSAGGILALEAARQLQQQPGAIKVSQLILFDSPNPIGLQNPPQRMYDFFDSLGIFGGGGGGGGKNKINKTPEWLRAHFDAFLRILDVYEPAPLPDAPASLVVYARDGVCKDPNGPRMETYPDDPREMLWLLNNRTDFSADGWASVLGPENLRVRVLDDVNHFSLVDPGPKMKEMGQIVTNFLSREIQ